jgi:hypothetical protein
MMEATIDIGDRSGEVAAHPQGSHFMIRQARRHILLAADTQTYHQPEHGNAGHGDTIVEFKTPEPGNKSCGQDTAGMADADGSTAFM